MNHILTKILFIAIIAQIIESGYAKKHHRNPHKGRKANGSKSSGGKIVGGEESTIEDQPYQAYLLTEDYNGEFYDCGGSLISNTCILTAAHCMDEIKNTHIVLGSTSNERGGQSYESGDYTIHPKYDQDTTNNDVAVLRLPEKVEPNGKTIKIVKINDAGNEPKAGTVMTVSGWGVTQEDGDTPENLRAVQVTVRSREDCEREDGITAQMFCASDTGKDSCQGDSGGPAVEGDTRNDPTQIGIVSWGIGCAREGNPGVYTNIADPSIRDFIRDNCGV